MKDKKEIKQIRDKNIEDYKSLIKDKNPAENFDTQMVVLSTTINILTSILEDGSFNLVSGKLDKKFSEDTDSIMFTEQIK
jgi:hypothetical protein